MPPPKPLPQFLYKILPEAPLHPLPETLPLSPLDASDGFIHLSTAAQIPGTASRFFAKDIKLWLLKLPLGKLIEGSGELKWEESSNHGCFAHLYDGDVGRGNVDEVLEFVRGERGWEDVLKGLED